MNQNLNSLLKRVNALEKELTSVKEEIAKISSFGKSETDKKPEIVRQKIPKVIKKDYEYSIGGYIIGIIGAVAVLIACGWFIKLAIEKSWLNESARIILGILFGFSIIIASWVLIRKKFKILPNIIFGLGYAVLYIILFSAYNFYELLNINETFIYLFALSIVSTFIANLAGSQILYIFSLTGAFLAPLIISQGENSYRFLFSYLTVLNLIFIFISYKFRWKTCAYLLLGFNSIIYLVWALNNLNESSFLIPILFLTSIFMIFMLRNYFVIRKDSLTSVADHILFILNVFVYVSLGHYTFNTFFNQWIPHFYLIIYLFILIWNYFYHKKEQVSQNRINQTVFILIALIPLFLTAGSYYFEGSWIITIFIALAGTLSVIGAYLNKNRYIIASLPFWIIALISVWSYNTLNSDIALIINSRFYLYLICFILLGITFVLQPGNKIMWSFGYAALLMILIGSLLENHEIFIDSQHLRRLSYSYILLFYAFALIIPGFIFSRKMLRFTGLGLIGIVILKFYFYDIWVFNTIVRITAGLSLGGILILTAVFYQKLKERILKKCEKPL